MYSRDKFCRRPAIGTEDQVTGHDWVKNSVDHASGPPRMESPNHQLENSVFLFLVKHPYSNSSFLMDLKERNIPTIVPVVPNCGWQIDPFFQVIHRSA